jgi:pimeloyl-ACP methyl ester carboxylesterase
MPAAMFQSIRRPGGQRLAWCELGDHAGQPVIYCHGFPSSRREAMLLDPVARTQGMRILAPDRPGYGDSSDQPGRTIPDWSEDIAALADHLGLGRFSLLGVSGGAPYALACAWRIRERICACALVCPLGPVYLDDMLAAMAWPARLNLTLARQVPDLAHFAFGGLTAGLLTRWPQTVDRFRTLTAPPADRAELAQAETRAILNRTIADAMRGGARGARRDLLLYTRPWGIPLGEIALPIQLWHGEADGTVPIAHARWYERHLPNCRAHYLPDEGHYSLPLRHAGTILAALRLAA